MKHFDTSLHILGRIPSPFDLCRAYAFRDSCVTLVPLPITGGMAVMLISYVPHYAVIPAAHFNRAGYMLRLPAMGTDDLVKSSRCDLLFPSEIRPSRPLRTMGDPRLLAETWARTHLDTEWRGFVSDEDEDAILGARIHPKLKLHAAY